MRSITIGKFDFNTAESVFGDISLRGANLIVPFFNIKLNSELNLGTKYEENTYIDFSWIVLYQVISFTSDYKLSREIDLENRICIGGVNFLDKRDYEFWLEFDKIKIVIPNQFQLSPVPFILKNNNLVSDFFNNKSPVIP